MNNLHLKWSKNNAKLKKLKTISFSTPAFRSADGFEVCPKAGGCATLCYARQGHYTTPVVANAREYNLAKARGPLPLFIQMAIEDLHKLKPSIVRLHDSGDFFSQPYLDAWCEVMGQFPKVKFYAYTKSFHLDFSRIPSNFQVVQSMGGLMDSSIDHSKSHARMFPTHSARRAAGYVDGNVNDAHAIKGTRNIGLVYHGTRNLKEGQIAWLRSV